MISNFIERTFISKPSTVDQLSRSTVGSGYGQAHWRFASSDGGLIRDILPEKIHLIPSAHICLFSPQAYIHQPQQGRVLLDVNGCTLNLLGGRSRLTLFNHHNNLPILQPLLVNNLPSLLSTGPLFYFHSIDPHLLSISVSDETNQNISPTLK